MEQIKNNLKNLHKNKPIRTIIAILLFLIIVLTAFQAGIFIGYQKASFSNGLGNKYYKQAFEGDRWGGSMMGFFDRDLPGGNGAVGKIVRIDTESIVVATPDNIEKTVKISKDTLIRRFRDEVTLKELKVGDQIVVLGSQNDKAEVEAKLIRLLPPPPSEFSAASKTLQTSSTLR